MKSAKMLCGKEPYCQYAKAKRNSITRNLQSEIADAPDEYVANDEI